MTRETHLYRVIFQETRVIKPRSRRFARDRYRFIKHRNDTLKMELVELTRAFSFLSSLFPFFRSSMKRGEFPCMINACKFLNGKKSELENLREIRHDKVTLNLVKIPSLPFTARLVYFGLFLYFFFFFFSVIESSVISGSLNANCCTTAGRKLTCTALLYVSRVLMGGERYGGKSIDSLHVRFHHFPFGVKSRSPFKRSINGRAAFCAPTIVLTVC